MGYNLYTLWLLTYSDLKTTVYPTVVFGVFSSLSGPVLTTNVSSKKCVTFSQVMKVALWTWVHTLFVDIQNQVQPGAAEEDKINKSWRPIPAGRLTKFQMNCFLSAMYLMIPMVGLCSDTSPQSLGLMVLGFIYNDLRGADNNFVVRNLLNALGISCLCSGATTLALTGSQGSLTAMAHTWFLLISTVIFTTVQVQDMADQAGDHLRQRRTLPLVFGDGPARWTIAIPVAFWSFLCPRFLHMGAFGFLMPLLVGGNVIFRTLTVRSVEGDKHTYRVYNLWMVILFLLPFLKCLGDVQRG